jgi:hypothetical protein
VLMGRGGPFAQCSEDEHIEPREARATQAPAGWWDASSVTDPVGVSPGYETDAGPTG